jgi:uncharacterized membrane protein YhaH (DUF805 family)
MFKPYRDYSLIGGRSRRMEYWAFVAFCVAAYFPLAWLDQQPHLLTGEDRSGDFPLTRVVFWVYSLLPFLCVTVRRLHDTGRDGWWVLLYLVPVVGWTVLLYFMALDSEPGTNGYGPYPKGAGTARTPG